MASTGQPLQLVKATRGSEEKRCFSHDDWPLAWRIRAYMYFLLLVRVVCSFKTQVAEVYPPAAPYLQHCCTQQNPRALR
jgi:hypothetical protein